MSDIDQNDGVANAYDTIALSPTESPVALSPQKNEAGHGSLQLLADEQARRPPGDKEACSANICVCQ
jgi:hypothetical protein